MANSCNKGKVGERELANYLRSLGFTDARRTQQHNGAEGKSDVVCEDSLPGLHIECKFGYPIGRFDLGTKLHEDACEQARTDSDGSPWCVLWRPKGLRQWRMTFYDGDALATIANDEAIYRRLFGLITK